MIWPVAGEEEHRIHCAGKFFRLGDEKYFLKGVSYGPFPPGPDGALLPSGEALERDLAQVTELGANVLRLHEIPDTAFLDSCRRHGLRVMITIPWTHHVDFFENPAILEEAVSVIRRTVSRFRGDSTVFAYLVANEIPATLVRWLGPTDVKQALERLIAAGKEEDPEALFSYATYPSTEYLFPDNQDFFAYNIYLEDRTAFRRYLTRLQHIAGDLPLIVSEFGLDSLQTGEAAQADALDWHLEEVCKQGLAGTTVFAFSDRWYRGGQEITGWDFGLIDREGRPKEAYLRLKEAWSGLKSPAEKVPLTNPPKISVIICTYRGGRTLEGCLASLRKLKYPNYEALIVNDGGDHEVAEIAARYPEFRHLTQDHAGLSVARNFGAENAGGSILVYTDDDCEADEDWLTYLALTFAEYEYDAVGGPNIPPKPATFSQACVAAAPGAPAHVMVNDRTAEHIPGCNLAVTRRAFKAIKGFDPQFRTAGDDVDFCWRLQQAGYRIGFHPGAMVWHYRRFHIKGYFRQQIGYGDAEAKLIPLHPDRFGVVGGARWQGFVYDRAFSLGLDRAGAIYQGIFGYAGYQAIYGGGSAGGLSYIFSSFQWLLVAFALALLSPFFLLTGILAAVMVAATLATALQFGFQARVSAPFGSWKSRFCISYLALVQPIVRGARRYFGSLAYARLPERLPSLTKPLYFPRLEWWPRRRRRSFRFWSEQGLTRDDLLPRLREAWQSKQYPVSMGDGWRSWDLEVSSSAFWTLYVTTVTEYHAAGKCLTRLRLQANQTPFTTVLRLTTILVFLLSWKLTGVLWWPLGICAIFYFSFSIIRSQLLSRTESMIENHARNSGLSPLP